MLWAPQHHYLGDPTVIRVGGEYHFFSEQAPLDGQGPRVIGHSVSTDMLHWEEQPHVLEQGPPGEFDGFTIYHFDVLIWKGKWYIFYTGLDKRGPGQKQLVGVAVSDDGVHYAKHAGNPVLGPDKRWYEQFIPDEATYQEKDRGRMWFRDPMVMWDKKTSQFVMIVIARDAAAPLDVSGCLAAATSDDLLTWKAHPPIFSPRRFHTVETPSIFEREGRHYIVYMTHPDWGGPVMTTDPYQDSGDFYAVSDSGWAGPYRPLSDEVLVAAHGPIRLGAQRLVDGPDGTMYLYGWLHMNAAKGDAPQPGARMAVPYFKPVRFMPDGVIHVLYNPIIDKIAKPAAMDHGPALDEKCWRSEPGGSGGSGGVHGKDIRGRSVTLYGQLLDHLIFSARVRFTQGERAGLVMRADAQGKTGWYAVADRRFGRVEFGTLDGEKFIDARLWTPAEEVELTAVVYGPVVEIYADGRLMIQQVRYRESSGRPGLILQNAEASFSDLRLRSLPAPRVPTLPLVKSSSEE